MSWVHRTALEQKAALLRGEISSLELLEATITHTENLTPYLNPIAVPLYERARAAAIQADKKLAKRKGGALCGIPITIKDSQWLAGVPCANGSVTLKDFIPKETSGAVQRLENAGAVIFGKTTCPEFSLSGITESQIYGRTSNPWNISRTSGGSSGGAAAAVSAGMGSLSLGGDGGGSIRIPSAFCGTVGFKPSHGTVPRSPGFTTWESIVAYGPISRSVADAKLMYAVLAGLDLTGIDNPGNQAVQNEKFSGIIASEDLGFAPVDADVRAGFRSAMEKIQTAGYSIKHDNAGLTSSVVPWAITATKDMWDHKGQSLTSSEAPSKVTESMGNYAREFIAFGGSFSDIDYDDAQQQRSQIHDAYVDLFKRNRATVLLTPTLGCEAFPHGSTAPDFIEDKPITYPWLDWAGFLYDANLVGMPACSIPMGIGDEGLPISMQIMGLPGHDLEVLNTAEKIEHILQWHYPSFDADSYVNSAEANILAPIGNKYAVPPHGLPERSSENLADQIYTQI